MEEPELNNSDPQSLRNWVTWATDEIQRLNRDNDTLNRDWVNSLSEGRRTKEELKKATKQIEILNSVIDSRKAVTVYRIGQGVYCGPNNISGEVVAIGIGKAGVMYKVGYWLDGRYIMCHMPEEELAIEPPLNVPTDKDENYGKTNRDSQR